MRNSLLVRQMLSPGMPPVSRVYQCDTQLLMSWRHNDRQLELEVHQDGHARWTYRDQQTGEAWEHEQDMDEPVVALAYTQLMQLFAQTAPGRAA